MGVNGVWSVEHLRSPENVFYTFIVVYFKKQAKKTHVMFEDFSLLHLADFSTPSYDMT